MARRTQNKRISEESLAEKAKPQKVEVIGVDKAAGPDKTVETEIAKVEKPKNEYQEYMKNWDSKKDKKEKDVSRTKKKSTTSLG